jgi:HD domain
MSRQDVNNAVTGLSTIAEGYFARYRYPGWLRTHSLVVGAIATRVAEAHAVATADLDVRTVGLGGYLHDIGKSPLLAGDARGHSVLGPLVLAAEGLPEVAELSRRHPVYAPRDAATAPRTLAEKIVYYADRRGGLRVVTLEERIDEQQVRFPELARFRASDLAMARAIEADVFRGIALRPEDLG